MVKIPNIVPITDLRQDATTILKRVAKLREPLIITQRGRAAAVMVSIEEYEHSQHELELLRLLAQGEKEIEAGKGYDLDVVLSEADKLLRELHR
jgi:prevent-host-death family protein